MYRLSNRVGHGRKDSIEQLILPSTDSRSLGFLHSIELGLELFARVFVVDAGREPNVIKRKPAIGIR
jgi:hypothetical protein